MFKDPPLRDPGYLRFVSRLPCCYRREGPCQGDVVAAHIRIGSGAGMGMKPDDDLTVPLCFAHHNLQHNKGELWFWGEFINEAKELAAGLFQTYKALGPDPTTERIAAGVVSDFIITMKNKMICISGRDYR